MASMASALCPRCGAALYRQVSGTVWTVCTQCAWSGQATFHYLPPNQGSGLGSVIVGGVGYLPNGVAGATYPIFTATPAPADTPPDPLAAQRARATERLALVSGTVTDLLLTVDTEDWQMPAWRRYERLQRAHAALFAALGGARMGDYRPAAHTLDEALAEVLLWALLTLDAVEG